MFSRGALCKMPGEGLAVLTALAAVCLCALTQVWSFGAGRGWCWSPWLMRQVQGPVRVSLIRLGPQRQVVRPGLQQRWTGRWHAPAYHMS